LFTLLPFSAWKKAFAGASVLNLDRRFLCLDMQVYICKIIKDGISSNNQGHTPNTSDLLKLQQFFKYNNVNFENSV